MSGGGERKLKSLRHDEKKYIHLILRMRNQILEQAFVHHTLYPPLNIWSSSEKQEMLVEICYYYVERRQRITFIK